MRKITSLLMLLCVFAVAAWAQTEVADVANLSNEKAYVIQSKNGQYWTYNSNVPTMMSNTQTASQTPSNDNANQHYAFLKSGENYYLYSVAAKKFVNKSGGGTAFVEYPEHKIVFVAASEARKTDGYPHVVVLNGSHVGISPGYGDQQGVITHYNNTDDGGNAVKITEVIDFTSTDAVAKINLGLGAERNVLLAAISEYTALYEAVDNKEDEKVVALKTSIDDAISECSSNTATAETLIAKAEGMESAYANIFVKLSEIQSGVAYRIRNYVSGRYMTVVNETVTGVQIKDYSESVNQLFYIAPNGENYTIQCCTGKYVTALSAWDVKIQDEACDFVIMAPDMDGIYKIKRTDKGEDKDCCVGPNNNAVADASPLYSNHGDGNGNCEWLIETVNLEDLKAGLKEGVQQICYEPVGAVGVCTATAEEKAKLNDTDVNALTTFAEILEYGNLLNKIQSTEKALTAGIYFIKAVSDGKYATYNENGGFIAKALAGEEILTPDYIWNFEAVPDETGYFRMRQVNSGKYTKLEDAPSVSSANNTVENANKFTIVNEGAAKLIVKNSDNQVMRTENNGDINYYYYDKDKTWYIIEVAELELTISDAGYATTYLPFAVTLPNTLEAYAVTELEDSKAMLTQKDDIPANTAALLKGEPGKHTLTIGTASADWTGNKLLGTNIDTEVALSAYVLSKGTEGVGFYPAKLTDSKFTNNANKAYLPADVAAARFFLFDFGTETAIESIQGAESANTVVYDLAGRRVQGAQRGLYIVNGKKVIK